MRNVRVFVPGPLSAGARIALPAEAAHHIVTVLRLGAGAALELFDGTGGSHRGRLVEAGRRTAAVELESFDPGERESPLAVTLAQGVSRGQHMDYTLQKAVELGVARIVPVLTARSNVRLDEGRSGRRLEHWRRIVIGACEQCGRNRVPDITAPLPLPDWLGMNVAGTRLVLDPEADARLDDLPPQHALTLLSGPEGGLAPEEVHAAAALGWQRLRLGPRILRTETAAVAALAACQARWGDLR
jgi:16S rRNA (uracil1498-N3)-methyltransferase